MRSAATHHDTVAVAREDRYPSRVEPVPRFLERKDPTVYGKPEDGPLSANQLTAYGAEGVLAFPGFFSPAEIAPAIRELETLRANPRVRSLPEAVIEPDSDVLRSIFAVHVHDDVLRALCHHPQVVAIARQLLGSEVYMHQSRVNYKPGFSGREFYWHSDFETWHVEDGMPAMRAVSCSISLTENFEHNGPLMVIPGSHKHYVTCVGETPAEHYKQSLRRQQYGVPDPESLAKLVDEGGIRAIKGPPGSITFFECNLMHGSASNITPFPRHNLFMVFNSVENRLVDPFCGLAPRPAHVAERSDYTPIPSDPGSPVRAPSGAFSRGVPAPPVPPFTPPAKR